jgi:hypothetical protein
MLPMIAKQRRGAERRGVAEDGEIERRRDGERAKHDSWY